MSRADGIDALMSWGSRSGSSFLGRAWSQHTLIRIAYAYEGATLHRRAPKLPLSLGLSDAV